jgi:hypothetical protein
MKTILIVLIIILTFIVIWRIISVIQNSIKNNEPPLVVPDDSNDPNNPDIPNNPDNPNGPNYPKIPTNKNKPTDPSGGQPITTSLVTKPSPTTTPPANTWIQTFQGNFISNDLSSTPKDFFGLMNNIIPTDGEPKTINGISISGTSIIVPDTTNNYSFNITSDMEIRDIDTNVVTQATNASIKIHTGISTTPSIQTLPATDKSGIVENIDTVTQSTFSTNWGYLNAIFPAKQLYFYIYYTDNNNFNLSYKIVINLKIEIHKIPPSA